LPVTKNYFYDISPKKTNMFNYTDYNTQQEK